ncbi:hypothetical protein TPA4_14 [Tsukamurella phage TPA4]|uniref:hypothetical protein n=1 Tax=Tsukamurella phage TPA4 TaxID=1647476 RepID=UPI0007B6396E|nr:hypothetical protein BH784_gp14 [Tsukamurella phage TPA4]AKJ72179.1 hypothetical protein TPA4_14 [Tsukamurella phage TPA4]
MQDDNLVRDAAFRAYDRAMKIKFGAAAAALAAVALLVGCGGQEKQSSSTETVTVTAAPTASSTAAPAALTYPSGDKVLQGYPLIVNVKSLDPRIVSNFEGKLVNGKVVALAPGVYAPYSPVESNLAAYLDGPSDGDCTVRNKYFPTSGGSCWNGVLPGSEEPPI